MCQILSFILNFEEEATFQIHSSGFYYTNLKRECSCRLNLWSTGYCTECALAARLAYL